MRRLRLVRPCPDIPDGLVDALDRDGTGFCDRCGETVIDLTKLGVEVPVKGAGRTCARILVGAALAASTAACGSSPLGAAPETQPPVVVMSPPRPDAGPLDDRMYMLGEIDIEPDPAPPPPKK